MSKWIDQFKAHPFQNVWKGLKDSIEILNADDETIITSVTELARLKKVVEYIDGMIEGVDPELIPLSTWDPFNQQATACQQQIETYNRDRNIVHIVQANAHVDNLLTYIRPYMVFPENILPAIKSASEMYSKTIEEYIASFQSKSIELIKNIELIKENANDLLSEIKSINENVDSYDSHLFEKEGIKEKIQDFYENFVLQSKLIDEFYNEVLVSTDDTLSIKQEISTAKKSIVENKEKIQNLISSIGSEVDNLEEFHTKIFGKLDENEEYEGGLSGELDKLKDNLSNFEIKQKAKYNALNYEIESLLPGATSAGLATAYSELRKSFSIPLKFYSKTFYISLVMLFMVSITSVLDDIGWFYVKFVDISSLTRLGNNILYKITLFLPVIWLAVFASRRRSEAQRLEQEYAHKEAIAKSYQSFKQQVKDLGDEDNELLKVLMVKAIDAISYNASETLDGKHGDKMPAQEMFDSVVNATVKLKGQ